MIKKIILIVIVLGILLGLGRWYLMNAVPNSPVISTSNNLSATTPIPTLSPSQGTKASNTTLVEPTAQFKQRITKKFFGTYVTPQNSPVSPERFTGYHAGVDVEYGDVTADVPVYALADGEIVSAQTASGYGGVMVIKFTDKGENLYAIYGHIRLSSAKKSGAAKKGEQIAVLGTAFSPETDNERRHLHFGIATQNTIRGYVSSKSALSPTFIDPLSFYP